jgi:hypothetical protein
MAAARRTWFQEPRTIAILSGLGTGDWGLDRHLRRGETVPVQRLRQQQGIAHTLKHFRRVAPQRATPSQPDDGIGMILVICRVRDRVARDCLGEPRRGVRGKAAFERLRLHRRVLIQIAKRVDGDDREPGARRGFGRGSR